MHCQREREGETNLSIVPLSPTFTKQRSAAANLSRTFVVSKSSSRVASSLASPQLSFDELQLKLAALSLVS